MEETSVTYDQETRNKKEAESNFHSLYTLSQHQNPTSSDKNNDLNGIKNELMEEVKTQYSEKVSRNVYLSYILAGGNACQILFLILVCILTEILGTGGDWWISYWYVE